MPVLRRCLEAARRAVSHPSAVRKAGFPSRDDFDTAREELADELQQDGERFLKAYMRASESEEGELLYTAREAAPVPEMVWKKESRLVLSKSEEAIAAAVSRYQEKHPDVSPEKAMCRVLEAHPELYVAYEREAAAELSRM